jgi:hypothetical protein
MASEISYGSALLQIEALAASGRSIVFLPNPGTLGDALINAATIQGFERAGIGFSVFSSISAHDDSFVYVYGGGGNLVPYYDNCVGVLRDLSLVGAEVIVLPHSCFGSAAAEVIASFGGKLSVWARERVSFNFLSLVSGGFSFGLGHDLALGLDLSDKRLHSFLVFDRLAGLAGVGVGELLAFRSDCEAIGGCVVDLVANVDLSNILGFSSRDSLGFDISFLDVKVLFNCVSWFLAYIRLFGVVRTDRLHVAVGALLLGKKVFFSDNSYGKCKAVYDFSLRERFGGLVVPCWDL